MSLSNLMLSRVVPEAFPMSNDGYLLRSIEATSPFNTPTLRICLSSVLAEHIASPRLYSISSLAISARVEGSLYGFLSNNSLFVLL